MLPWLIGMGVAGVIGAAGKSVVDDMQNETQNTIDEARDIFDNAKRDLENQQEDTEYALEKLGNKKIDLVTGILPRFVDLFDKFNNIKFENNEIIDDTDDLQLSNFSKSDFDELVRLVDEGKLMRTNLTAGAITAVALGGISTASGGMTLAAGFGGTLLSGVAAPAALVGYLAAYLKADDYLEEAKTKLAEAKTEAEKMKTSEEILYNIEKLCEMFSELLDNLESLLKNGVKSIEKIIASHSEKCRKNGKIAASNEERKILASTFAFAKAIKTVIQVPILNDNGNVSYMSKKVCREVSDKLPELKNGGNIDALELINVLSSVTTDYSDDIDYDVSMRDSLLEELEDLHGEFESKQEILQDRYDERSCNEPEYESARERWQDALDRLEEQIDQLSEVNERFYDDIIDDFDDLYGDDICCEIDSILDDYIEYNDEYKGITPLIKRFEKLIKEANEWNENGQLELMDE